MTAARVLFVDDEPRILDGVRRSLRGQRGQWDMSFVTGGAEALDLLGQSPHDVVVSDMRMPGMDGAELLTLVSHRHPEVARIVLSGHTEPEAALRVAMVAHRFLTKPSDPEHLIAAIAPLAAGNVGGRRSHARQLAGGVRALPALSRQRERLAEALGAPEVERAELSRAVRYDVGLTAKLLQLSQSSFFGARTSATTVDNIVNALGIPTVRALVDAGDKLWSAVSWEPAVERQLNVVWRHATATACLVDSLASPANRAFAHAAALLQDVGRFVCVPGPGDTVQPTVDLGLADCHGVPYLDLGVELLHLWGLPTSIVTAVAQRHVPSRPDPSGLGVTAAVRTAHLLIQQTESRDPADGTHDDELTELLSHPQLTAVNGDWHAAARDASELADRWCTR